MRVFIAAGAVAFGLIGLQPAVSQADNAANVLDASSSIGGQIDGDASLADLTARFLDREGYRREQVESLAAAIEEGLTPALPASVFPASGQLGPLSTAILALEAQEGILPRARYRLFYGMAMVDAPPAADPVPVSFVQLDRFNLGPAIRDELVRAMGADNVAPAEAFGEGPDVSYRLVVRPVMGRSADIVAAARKELSPGQADAMTCLGLPCATTEALAETATDWLDMDAVALTFAPPYPLERGGLITPAAAIDMLALAIGIASAEDGRFQWVGFEPRESVEAGEAFAEAVIEVGLGQDDVLDVVMREGEVMDHSVLAVWQRITGLSRSGDGAPAIYGARAFEHRSEQH